MGLNYDFDMFSPDATDDTFAEEREQKTGQPMALFRDPATVAAFGRSPQVVQDYLRASHFGLGVHRSGAPDGRYPATDEAARIAVIEALAENVGKFDLPRPDDTQPVGDAFHMAAFFAAVAEAEPIRMVPGAVSQVATADDDLAADADIAAEPLATPDASVADAIIADDSIAALVADEGARAEALIADVISEALAFDPFILDDDASGDSHATVAATGAATDDGDRADAVVPDDMAMPAVIAARRFQLPTLPRWLTAGAAFAVLGAAFGSAII
ncbi:MAG: hypothetical protein ACT4OK_04275 [Gemmobacter sp.]